MSNNQQQTEKGSALENIKLLNALLQSGGITSTLSEIKTLRKKLDAIIHSQREIVSTRREAARQVAEEAAKKEEPPAPPPPPEKKTAKILPSAPAEEAVLTPPPPPAPEKKKEQKREEKQPPVEEKKQFEATSQKMMPSYIRGVVVPPPPKPAPARTPYQQRGQQSGDRPLRSDGNRGDRPPRQDGFAPRKDGFTPRQPFNNTGTTGAARPGMAPRPGMPPRTGTGSRPLTPGGLKNMLRTAPPAPSGLTKDRKPDKKKEYGGKTDDKKTPLNKRTLIRKGFITENLDDERMGSRKLKTKKTKEHIQAKTKKIEKAIITTENLTVKILSEKIGKTAQEIIKQLMVLGIMTTINSVVDFPTMELVAGELGIELELKVEQSKESRLEDIHDEIDAEEVLIKRPPVVTVMGHVDHGKTSLLDAIRTTNVIAGEAGGITQHIGAYSVVCKNERITFLDTPGHEAFTQLRARGARVTDIAILIVAADDGVMPQTVEAIDHARAANVPILVAINKIDKPGANIEKIKQELTAYNLVTEEWGGDTIMVPISAKRGDGIDKLLEMVLFMAEYNNYRANPVRTAKGLIIEAQLDKGKGPIANIIVQNGTLHVGDFVVSGVTCGRVRAMTDENGRRLKEAPPSTPVSIQGLEGVPGAGDGIFVVEDEKMAKQIIEERNVRMRNEQANQSHKASLDELMGKINEGLLKELNLIIKADAQGSVDALKNSINKITNEEVKVKIVHAGVGNISKSDIMLADISHAIIVGFNIHPDADMRTAAEREGVELRLYNIIYEAIDDVERAMKGMIAPKYREVITGRAQVRSVFKITGSGMIAGSYVQSGKLIRGHKARVFRDGAIVHEGQIDGLKRFKDDVKEVATNFECGISVTGYTDIKVNDEIECFVMEEIK